jgi:hypothetical protein
MLGLLERMIGAQTIDEVWTCYLKGLQGLGFVKAMYGLVNFHPKLPSFASFEVTIQPLCGGGDRIAGKSTT